MIPIQFLFKLNVYSNVRLGPVYTTSFVLNGIHPTSIYEAVVSARNQFGWSDVSETLQFSTGRNGKNNSLFCYSNVLQK